MSKRRSSKDTDYLFISARLRAMERNLLTGARMDRMVVAPTAADAAKVLQEIGYGEFSPDSQASPGQAPAQEGGKTF